MPTWVLPRKGKAEIPKLHDRYTLGQVQQASRAKAVSELERHYHHLLSMMPQVLGKGAFGIVYTAQDKLAPDTYACKSIAKAKLVSEVAH